MEAHARMTTKGQLTVPKAVRDALGLETGDSIVFRVEGHRAVLVKQPDLLDLERAVRVPAGRRNSTWDEIVARIERHPR